MNMKDTRMFTHEEMIGLQAEKHGLVDAHNFSTKGEYVLQLIQSFSYVQASRLSENKIVLDLGCNTGYGSEILSGKAKKVVGVDVSEKAILLAKQDYGHLGIDFKLIDGQRLPFSDNEFDIVVSCQVIEHIVDYSIYLNELKRVLSPRGIVLFTTPNSLLRLDPGMKPWNRFHVREFNHSELKNLLNNHFAEVQIMGLFAEKTLYLIEKNRVTMARRAARRTQQTNDYHQHSFLTSVKRMIPTSIKTAIKKKMISISQPNRKVDKTFMETYGLKDFFYRVDDLSMALDLLAICADDASSMNGVMTLTNLTKQ
jgi:ubiquinone/menaquinone biosynthesis C-methylase UbiE